jgi:signal transduction histidine kinase
VLASSENANRGLLRSSRAMAAKLRRLSHRLLTSHEEERTRISRELHDALGQSLTAVNVDLAVLTAAEAVDSKAFRGRVARTQRSVQKSMTTVHRFASELRPTLLDDLGLTPALRGYAREFGRRNSLDMKVSAPALRIGLDDDSRTALFRVAQEALVNVGRHARASNVRVALRRLARGIRLSVWNDGRTFDPDRVRRSRTHRRFGILCMKERMKMVGGTLEINSSQAKGTSVVATVPLPEVFHA